MWIRSQDGTKLVNANQLIVERNKIICRKWVLGEYETDTRAKEVLDELQDHLIDYKNSYREIFEMPQE